MRPRKGPGLDAGAASVMVDVAVASSSVVGRAAFRLRVFRFTDREDRVDPSVLRPVAMMSSSCFERPGASFSTVVPTVVIVH